MEQLKLLTTRQVAAQLGLQTSRIRQLAIARKIRAIKIGRDWMITEQSVNEYKEARKSK